MFLARIFFVGLLLVSTSAHAEKQHALAMHGEPLYKEGEVFDYVSAEASKGGEFRLAAGGTFDNLNSIVITGNKAQGLTLLNSKLMQRAWNEPFTLYGLVAQYVDVAEDRSSITFYLNPNAKFHDGHPMTTEDVKFSYEMYQEHGHPVRRRVYGLIDKVDVVSDTEIKFTFGEGYDEESVLILGLMEVLPKHYWEAEGRDIGATTLEPPLGSGPYKIKSLEPGREIVYERVVDYWGEGLAINSGHYNFDTVKYSYYRDDDVALEAFKAGEYDVRDEHDISKWKDSYDVDPEQVVKEEITHGRPEWVRAMIFNTRRPLFQDIRVRQALSMMFDFDWVNQSFFFNEFKRIDSTFPNSTLAAKGKPSEAERALLEEYKGALPAEVWGDMWQPYTGSVRARQREAVRLLKEAGWEYQDQKLVNTQSGEPFTFEMLLSSPGDEKIALFYANTLQRMGVEAKVRTVDTVQFTGRLAEFDYDMVFFRWINSLSPGAEQVNYWGSDAANTKGGRNYVGLKNTVVDEVALSIANSKTREELVTRTKVLDRILMWGHYFIPLYYSDKDMVARQSNIKRPDVTPVYGTVKETWWKAKD